MGMWGQFMSLPRYDSYKDSGVEWIGEIPEGWLSLMIKRLSPVKRGASPRPIDDPKYFDTDGEFAWVRIADVSASERYLETTTQTLSELGASLSVKRYPGDIFLSIAGTVGKPIISKIKCCIHDGFVYFPKLQINPEYLYYLFSTGLPYQGLGKWGTQLNLNTDTVGEIVLPIPSNSEMSDVVAFLDRKTAHIDQLIANKEKLIALYEEEKTAIINRAVTRGLPSTSSGQVPLEVKTRPSGVDWIGDIPEHWEVKRLKYVIKSITGGGTPSTGNPLFWNGTIPWVSPKDMKNAEISETEDYVTDLAVANSSTTLVAPNSILVVVRSGILKHTFPVAINRVTVCLNQDMKAIIPADCLDEKFLYWKLKGLSNIVLTVCNKMGATVDSIEVPDLLSLLVTFPQKAEQTAIVTHIETECARLDTIIEKFKKQIELFKEYRTTLISEVVTGKIDVRGEVGV
jgi:type I restriction enzyme S subunit